MTNVKHKIRNPETKIKLDFYHLPAHCAVVSACLCNHQGMFGQQQTQLPSSDAMTK